MTIVRTALILAALIGSVSAQHLDGRVESLGFGRARLHYVLTERQAVTLDEDGRVLVAEHAFRERWLRTRLVRTISDLESVDVLDRILARSGSVGSAVTRERILEVVGPEAAVDSAHRFVDRIVRSADKIIRARIWLVRRDVDDGPAGTPRIESVTERRLDEIVAEANYDTALSVVETMELAMVNGRESTVTVGSKRHFMSDFKVVSAKGSILLDPVIDSVLDGFEWRLGAVHDPGTRRTSVGASFTMNAVKKPIDRLEGQIGFRDEPVVIEKPVVARTVWSSESITLESEHGGFVVLGLPVWNMSRPGEPRRHEYSIICRIVVDDVGDDPVLAGRVQGFDAEARVAFVRFEAGVKLPPGRRVVFHRGNDEVGRGLVREVLGGLVLVDVGNGDVRAGDEVR